MRTLDQLFNGAFGRRFFACKFEIYTNNVWIPTMTGTVAELVLATSKHTSFSQTRLAQRARSLQTAGRLPVVPGGVQPAATPHDLMNILFSLAAEKHSHAPRVVTAFASLERISDSQICSRRAGDQLETLISSIWPGKREHDIESVVLTTHPHPRVSFFWRNGRAFKYYPPGTLVEECAPYDVSRSVTIPTRVIAAIGYEIGFKACAYAL